MGGSLGETARRRPGPPPRARSRDSRRTRGPVTTLAVLEAAAQAGVTIESIAVASTTLDDVFLHYTGHDLRDALQAPTAADSPFMLRR